MSKVVETPKLTIRLRSRRGYLREASGHTTWDEWQALQGRRVLFRGDFERQARDWADGYEDALSANAPGPVPVREREPEYGASYRYGYEDGVKARNKEPRS